MRGCDHIIHLAALKSVPYCEDHAEEAIDVNLLGTRNVASLAKKRGLPIIFASSFAAMNPTGVYGLTKRLGEKLVLSSSGVVLRIANVYGGDNFLKKDSSVIANFLLAKKSGEEAVVYGSGLQERDFIHVDDVCRAIITALSAETGIYEVCTGHQTSISSLTKMLRIKHRHEPEKKGDLFRVPSGGPQNYLKRWKPTISIRNGLNRETRLLIA